MSNQKIQLVGSLSGGETSMFTAAMLSNEDPSAVFVFANTGLEREETYEFIKAGTEYFGLNVIWVEAVINPEKGKGTKHKIVSFDTAHRGGDIFEAMIKVYGIPNAAYPHCTRELKNQAIRSYCVDNFGKNYKIAIGIRAEEKNRYPKKGSDNPYRLFYPLIERGIDKTDVQDFFEDSPVKLSAENYETNCEGCYKKSDEKLAVINFYNPEVFDFTRRMERDYGSVGCPIEGTKRVFFRHNRSTEQLIAGFNPDADYPALREKLISNYRDNGANGCAESCEAFQFDMFKDPDAIAEDVQGVIDRHLELDPDAVIKTDFDK